jgi:hypothetical protein
MNSFNNTAKSGLEKNKTKGYWDKKAALNKYSPHYRNKKFGTENFT